jgi:hypothetical protein
MDNLMEKMLAFDPFSVRTSKLGGPWHASGTRNGMQFDAFGASLEEACENLLRVAGAVNEVTS